MDLLKRPRRLRSSPVLRAMLRETALSPHDFILPLFVSEKITSPAPVASMPGVFQLTEKALVEEAAGAHADGVPAVLLFGIPAHKDEQASQAYAAHGVVQRSVRALKAAVPGLLVITDVCLCEFMSHGHCGVTTFHGGHAHVDNDASVALLAKTAVSHAEAGADIIAPSDMMDGRIGALRRALDAAGFTDTPLLSYAAKFASAFYGPFRDAAESAPACGDRRTYQMDPANALEALREVALDIEEGADLVMVKPGLPYLDLVWRIKEKFGLPTAAYHVSGEYAMLKAAAQLGWLDEKACVLEQMLAFKRAGADLILTYYARQLARWVREG
ncbi:MAG: porphobilinogen synthase [Verrucomicrobia bacterium]|nr:MAG: porphobilinogen synthase [Verrucomicrobiota bacterium]